MLRQGIQLAGIHLLYRSRNTNMRQYLCLELTVDGKTNLNIRGKEWAPHT